MLVVGLTGGIGSGKSTVAALFEKKGARVIDTDQLARDLTLPGQIAFNKIVEKWGKRILLADGTLDRAQLRKLIFSNPDERHWLEQLLHPLIRETMQALIQSACSPYCIAVIPLLLETKPNPLINRILVVDTTEKNQLLWAKKRDNLSENEIKAIIQTQVRRQERLAAADDVIFNHGPFEDLTLQVEKLHEIYFSLSGPCSA
ncbi:MAG: coaE 1 [Gammaproteobacteria bacterium]|jgi:dephospho-CoA kinase|nr:coaE 1 [Gammaproteobacteria bacterium]